MVAYFEKEIKKETLCNFLVWTLEYFEILNFFTHEKLKKTTPKIAKNTLIVFSLLPWAAQAEEFMFQNVAYRATVYKTRATRDKKKEGPDAKKRQKKDHLPRQ